MLRFHNVVCRHFCHEKKVVHTPYRFGYQGSEKDNEVSGDGNSYTTEFRQLDVRLGRWFSVDPVFRPELSPYVSMDNNPINLNDPMGDTPPGAKTHKTVSGDNYSKLAKKYGVTVEQLRKWNGFKDTEIPIGVELVVSDPNVVKTQVTNTKSPDPVEAKEIMYSRNDEDMSDVGKTAKSESGKTTTTTNTVEGAPRNSQAYWNKRLAKNDPALSQSNIWKIKNGFAPVVNDQWIKFNPNHSAYKGDKLIHHHINQGKVATAIPQGAHNKYFKELHPIRTNQQKANAKMRAALRVNTATAKVGVAYNIFGVMYEVFSDNPHTTWNYTFGNGSNVNQVYAHHDGGYYVIEKKNKVMNAQGEVIGWDATVNHYTSFTQDANGKYIGVGHVKTTMVKYRKDGTSSEGDLI